MTLSPDEPTDTTPEEGSTLVPEELQPDTQGLTPEEADEGPAGQGDMDATAYAEELEQERLDDGRAHPEQSLADGAPTEEGFAGEDEGGPTEQGYGETGLDSETYDNEAPDYPGSDSGRQTAG
jgi:hypothetical protein